MGFCPEGDSIVNPVVKYILLAGTFLHWVSVALCWSLSVVVVGGGGGGGVVGVVVVVVVDDVVVVVDDDGKDVWLNCYMVLVQWHVLNISLYIQTNPSTISYWQQC